MSAFFVGQRVKKVRGGQNEGATGVVASFDTIDPPYVVRLDRSIVNATGHVLAAGELVDAFQKHWEPILPSGAQPSEFKTLAELLGSLNEHAPA